MAKAARKVKRGSEAGTGRRPAPARIYTAWHPLIVVLLSRVLPEGYYQLLSEFQLAREPLRVDVVIVRRSRPEVPPAPHLLTSVVGDLAEHTLVHFKGPTTSSSATMPGCSSPTWRSTWWLPGSRILLRSPFAWSRLA